MFLAALALQAEFGDYMQEVQREKEKYIFQCVTAAHFILFFVAFLALWEELLPARALCVQENAREAGAAQCQGGVTKTSCKSCSDPARGG